eukprot:11749351-Ditylum_brightwellii.AAC.1
MRKYYQLKKKCGPMRSTLFEERIKALELEGEVEEAKKLHKMLANEKERECAARLRSLKEKENRAGVRSVQKEITTKRTDGTVICNSNGKSLVEIVEISEQKELERACIEEVNRRSRISEETPPMISPIIDLVGYTGVTDRADQILLGTSPKIPGIDKYTQLYIDQLRSVEG